MQAGVHAHHWDIARQVTRCTEDDWLVKYVRCTRDRGAVLRPGVKGILVSVYVEVAYGVQTDRRSHTGSSVVIGNTGAVHCKSMKQNIVTKS